MRESNGGAEEEDGDERMTMFGEQGEDSRYQIGQGEKRLIKRIYAAPHLFLSCYVPR